MDIRRNEDIAQSQGRTNARQRGEATRRLALLEDLEAIARDFAHDPTQIARFIEDLDEQHGLPTELREAMYWHLVERFGRDIAEQSLNMELGRRDVQRRTLADLQKESAARHEAAQQRANVIDLNAARAARTQTLLEQLAVALGIPLHAITVKVDEAARRETSARGARGLQRDGLVLLNPDTYAPETREGRALLAHEVTHLAQRGYVTGRGAELGPPSKRAAEGEAAAVGEAFASGSDRLPLPKASLPTLDVAADTDAAATEARAMPDKVDLYFAGRAITIELPASASKTVSVALQQSPLRGVTLTEATLLFDEEWTLQSGSVTAEIGLGPYVSMSAVTLTVNRDGNDKAQIATSIKGASLALGELLSGSLDLEVSEAGISGVGTLEHTQVALHDAIVLQGGTVTVSVDPEGRVAASGSLSGRLDGIGVVTVSAEISDMQVGGSLSVNLDEPIALMEGITLDSGHLEGMYTDGGLEIAGGVQLTLGKWVSSSIEARYNISTGSWSIEGDLHQTEPVTLGALTLSTSQLGVTVTDNSLEALRAAATVQAGDWEATVEGSYDLSTQCLNGQGTVRLVAEQGVTLGESGVTLTAASATATIADNTLTTIEGQLEAAVTYQGEPTFQVVGEALTFDVAAQRLSGTATLSTTRELTFGDEAGVQMRITSGASGAVRVEDNALAEVTGGIPFSVFEAGAELGAGAFDFRLDGPTQRVVGEASFELGVDYGFPSREAGPLIIKQGGALTVTLEGTPKLAELSDVAFYALNPAQGGLGRLAGFFSGQLAFDTMSLDASGMAAIEQDWPLPATWGEVLMKRGGEVAVEVKASELTYFDGTLPWSCSIETLHGPLSMDGELVGRYTAEEGAVSGQMNATIREAYTLPMGDGTDAFVLASGSTASAQISANQIEHFTMQLSAAYHRQGEHWLDGTLSDMTYILSTGELSGEGELTLMRDLSQSTDNGAWTFLVAQGATLSASIASNQLERLGGTIPWRVYDGDGSGEALLEGELSDASIQMGETPSMSGGLSMKTARSFVFPATQDQPDAKAIPPSIQLRVLAGSGVSGALKDNALETVSAELQIEVDLNEQPLGIGSLSGDWNLDEDAFTGVGKLTLARPFILGSNSAGDELESWLLVISEGSGIELKLTQNTLERAHIGCAAGLMHNETIVAIGALDGDYKLGDEEQGFTGYIEAQITERLDWSQGAPFRYWIEPDTVFKASVEQSKITRAEGTFSLTAEDDGVGKVNVLAMGSYLPSEGVQGEGQIQVLDDIAISQPSSDDILYIAKGSAGQGSVVNNALSSVSGQITLRLDRRGAPFGQGLFDVSYNIADGASSDLTATGSIELLAEVDITPSGSGPFTFTLANGSGLSCQLTQGQLDWIEGTMSVLVGDPSQGGDFLRADLTGKYTAGEAPDFSGTGNVEVIRLYDLGVEMGGYMLMLDRGGGASIHIQAFELEKLTSSIPLLIMNPQGMVEWRVALDGTYVHAESRFDGTGSAELLIPLDIAEGLGPEGDYALGMRPGTGLDVTIEANTLSQVSGTLNISVADGQGDFLLATASGVLARSEDVDELVSLNGKAEIIREKRMLILGEWIAFLEPGSEATASIEHNELSSLGGTLMTRLDGPEGPFARIALGGTYIPSGGFSGVGLAELMTEIEVVTVGDYRLKVLPGTGAEMTLVNTEPTHMGGNIQAQVDDLAQGAQRFISIQATADYDLKASIFSGQGSAEIHLDKALGELAGERLFLCAGTGAQVSLADNALQEVGGTINLRLEDAEGAYLSVALAGSFDAAGGTGFSGSGATEVTRDKKLAQLGDYSFWLAPGAGANAMIANNVLTQVDGQVPFKVLDSQPEPLLQGHANGIFTTESQTFSGSGAIYLGRDVSFELGSSTVAVFKKGSGGEAHVEANELRQLGGILTVEVVVDGEPLVDISAAGLYDAVDSKLLWVEGQATLKRPFELLDGAIIIDGVTGTARLEDNKLVRAGGAGRIMIPALNGIEGAFELNWSNETGQDVYSGTGTLNFALFNDPATGRSLSGEVSATYHEDHTLAISGEVDYQLTPVLGGTLGVEVDQQLDPVLNGTISVSGVEMVAGRNLFSLDIPLLPKMSIPVIPGVNIDFGANAGMALDLLPLMLAEASIGIANFRPMADDVTVPDFEAQLALSWGMEFEAGVAAYAGLSAGVPGANVGLGVEGEVELSAPITLNPSGVLRASGGEFSGELGIGLRLAPSLALIGRPYIQATLGKEFRHDLVEWEIPLGELFTVEWGTVYQWGDAGESKAEGPAGETPAIPPPSKKSGPTSQESAKFETASGSANDKAGGPQLGSGPEMGQRDGASQASEMAETLAQVQIIATGVSSLAKLIGELAHFVGAALAAGPVGMVVMLAWKLFKHGMSYFEMLRNMLNDVLVAIDTIMDIIAPYMPDWWNRIVGFFQDDPPSLLDALLGADDAMRDAVHAGEHRYLPPDARAEMIDTMMSGYCGDADEQCICEVLEWSASNGDLSAVVAHVDGGADQITWKLDGAEDTRVKRLFDRYGIRY